MICGCHKLRWRLLWLWLRLAAAAQIQSLAWELPYATGVAKKKEVILIPILQMSTRASESESNLLKVTSRNHWVRFKSTWLVDSKIQALSTALSTSFKKNTTHFFLLVFIFWAMPGRKSNIPRPEIELRHSSDLRHGSDNTRSLTCWATRELLFLL